MPHFDPQNSFLLKQPKASIPAKKPFSEDRQESSASLVRIRNGRLVLLHGGERTSIAHPLQEAAKDGPPSRRSDILIRQLFLDPNQAATSLPRHRRPPWVSRTPVAFIERKRLTPKRNCRNAQPKALLSRGYLHIPS